tara:strand:+ start:297 stop:689 length:393 start_codon:yes stop_codon:yes gene_type:complete
MGCNFDDHDGLAWGDMPPIQQYAILIALFCAIVATTLSIHLIYKHMTNFTNVEEQRHIVRILLMVPIYAIDSWCSLWFNGLSVYFDVARDCYEAFVLWEFFALLMTYLEGEENTIAILETKRPMKHPGNI